MYPVLYVPAKYRDYLRLSVYPNAGPRPNITGMRKIYGPRAYLIKCGVYMYSVPREKYFQARLAVFDY